MQQPVTAEVSEDKIIHITFHGDLLDEQVDSLIKSLAEALELIASSYQSTNEKVHLLVDLNDFSGKYSAKSIIEMAKFSKAIKQYVEKSAVFGGTDKERMAAEVVAALSMRDNIKTFDSKEKALEWLLGT